MSLGANFRASRLGFDEGPQEMMVNRFKGKGQNEA